MSRVNDAWSSRLTACIAGFQNDGFLYLLFKVLISRVSHLVFLTVQLLEALPQVLYADDLLEYQGLALCTKVATLQLVIRVSHLVSCSPRASYVIDHMAAVEKALPEGALRSSVSEIGSRTNAAPCT